MSSGRATERPSVRPILYHGDGLLGSYGSDRLLGMRPYQQQARPAGGSAVLAKMNFKQRSLLRTVEESQGRLYEEDLTQSEADVAKLLVNHGHLIAKSASWTGNTYYSLPEKKKKRCGHCHSVLG